MRSSSRDFEKGEIHPDSKLTSKFEFFTEAADVDAVLHLIDVAYEEQQERQERMGSHYLHHEDPTPVASPHILSSLHPWFA